MAGMMEAMMPEMMAEHRLAEQDEHRLAKLDDQSGERPGSNDIEGLGEEVGFEPHRLADQDEHRLAKLDDRAGLCKCSGDELCRSKKHVGTSGHAKAYSVGAR